MAVIGLPLALMLVAILTALFPVICTFYCTCCSNNQGVADFCDDDRRSSENPLDYCCCSIPNLLRAFYTEDRNETVGRSFYCFYNTRNGCFYKFGKPLGLTCGLIFSVLIALLFLPVTFVFGVLFAAIAGPYLVLYVVLTIFGYFTRILVRTLSLCCSN